MKVAPPATAGEIKSGTKPAKKATYAPVEKKPGQAKPAAKKTSGAKDATKKATSKPAATKKPAAKKKESSSDAAARAVGKQVSKMGGMFGSFMDEYKKASK